MSGASFPALRMRRTRVAAWSRAMVAEHVLTPSNLIWPLFITSGKGVEEPIPTLPGVSRWSVDLIADRAREARDLGPKGPDKIYGRGLICGGCATRP